MSDQDVKGERVKAFVGKRKPVSVSKEVEQHFCTKCSRFYIIGSEHKCVIEKGDIKK